MQPRLVIFDCDGVLVDTEAAANVQIAKVFSTLGPKMTGDEARHLFQGKTMEDVCTSFAEINGIPHDPELPKLVRRNVEEAMSSCIEAIPGVVDLVRRITGAGIPICVASSGSINKMHKTLVQIGLLEHLKDVLFSAQDVGRGKPHPDVFLHSARVMGVACEDAVIIEDSLSGVQAGITSGARVLGYCGDPFTDAASLENAGAYVFTHMDEVSMLIGL